jgi:hypothetical protein
MCACIACQPCHHHAHNTPNRKPDQYLHATNLRRIFANIQHLDHFARVDNPD